LGDYGNLRNFGRFFGDVVSVRSFQEYENRRDPIGKFGFARTLARIFHQPSGNTENRARVRLGGHSGTDEVSRIRIEGVGTVRDPDFFKGFEIVVAYRGVFRPTDRKSADRKSERTEIVVAVFFVALEKNGITDEVVAIFFVDFGVEERFVESEKDVRQYDVAHPALGRSAEREIREVGAGGEFRLWNGGEGGRRVIGKDEVSLGTFVRGHGSWKRLRRNEGELFRDSVGDSGVFDEEGNVHVLGLNP
jgi:hypothetical protein